MGTQDGFLEARHQRRNASVPIRPQNETQIKKGIMAMGGGDDEEEKEEVPVKRRRRTGNEPAASGACASAEMEELRKGLGMDDEEENALRPEEATEADMECGVCNEDEERGQGGEEEGEEGRNSVGIRAPQRV